MAPSATITAHEYESVYLNHQSLTVDCLRRIDTDDQKDLVRKTLERRVDTIDTDICEPGEEDAFFVADVGEVYRQHLRWKVNLGRVKPHYGK